jgi:hypothetical protein
VEIDVAEGKRRPPGNDDGNCRLATLRSDSSLPIDVCRVSALTAAAYFVDNGAWPTCAHVHVAQGAPPRGGATAKKIACRAASRAMYMPRTARHAIDNPIRHRSPREWYRGARGATANAAVAFGVRGSPSVASAYRQRLGSETLQNPPVQRA